MSKFKTGTWQRDLWQLCVNIFTSVWSDFLKLSFSDLLPLWDEEDEHDQNFLKHHDEDVEDTLAQPRCALDWFSYTHTQAHAHRLMVRKKPAYFRQLWHWLLSHFLLSSHVSHLAAKSKSDKLKKRRRRRKRKGAGTAAATLCWPSQTLGQSNTTHSPYSPKRKESHCLHSTIALTALTPA